MRLSQLLSWILLCGTLALTAPSAWAQAAARVAGRIVVARVQGSVTATNLEDKSQRALATNDVLTQHYAVATGAGSSVILVFSNGATINLGADSVLSIEEFLQDPFEKEIAIADLKEEPTSSTTRLNLARGELVGNVKHLRQERGSTFTVQTPVGAAGIRGTTFRIVFRPDANGKAFFTLSTADGHVLFEAPAGEQVHVESGKEVVVNVDVQVDATTGAVTVTAPPVIEAAKDMPAETQVIIQAAAQQSVEAAKQVILSTTTSTTPAPGGNPLGTDTNVNPDLTTQQPRTTSGDGR